MKKILVVEDESDIRELIVLHLKREGFEVDASSNGEDAMRKIGESEYDLFVFDWMLPGINGLQLTKTLRGGREASAPILMVTARVEPADIVLGLESGADDYITKPFEIPVFMARVRALLRRTVTPATTAASSDKIELGELVIDKSAHEVFCAGDAIQLTVSEFRLLAALAENRGRVLTRSRLIDLVQGAGVSVIDRTVDTHVFGLRKKMGPCADLIETIRGVGYRIK